MAIVKACQSRWSSVNPRRAPGWSGSRQRLGRMRGGLVAVPQRGEHLAQRHVGLARSGPRCTATVERFGGLVESPAPRQPPRGCRRSEQPVSVRFAGWANAAEALLWSRRRGRRPTPAPAGGRRRTGEAWRGGLESPSPTDRGVESTQACRCPARPRRCRNRRPPPTMGDPCASARTRAGTRSAIAPVPASAGRPAATTDTAGSRCSRSSGISAADRRRAHPGRTHGRHGRVGSGARGSAARLAGCASGRCCCAVAG